MTPWVSVVVPAYQGGAYLDQALTSLAAQTDKNWECVIVDDASPDDTGARAAAWAARDARFRVLTHDRNQGTLAAKNHGIAEARGTWIKPLDQDDRLHPEALAIFR